MKKFLLWAIRFYQKHLNCDQQWCKILFLTDAACRFQPTCSEYCYQAVERYGILKGLFLGVKRVARCHPLSKGGWDPISERRTV